MSADGFLGLPPKYHGNSYGPNITDFFIRQHTYRRQTVLPNRWVSQITTLSWFSNAELRVKCDF